MLGAQQRIPEHLRKYVVEQRYERYTPEDQAVWRFIMRQLKDFLSTHAHSCYVEGLKKTGVTIDAIPRIEDMDRRLSEFGWGAVPVSGFIPPAAFMEFQSLGILPIASDMRSIDHLTYTPAPDIVHEAAGHAPILIQPKFAGYLQKYAEVARRAIISKSDMDQYEAIRVLSDAKENPDSSPEDILRAERRLAEVNARATKVSEATWLSRMNWWTAEYGLIGSLQKPQIFGAGLLSSLGESRLCLSPKVRKLPLSIDCIEVGYDITEPQPQLFVTPDFDTLHNVLEELAQKMAFRIGGPTGLARAQEAQTVNTLELDSGLQISGVLSEYSMDSGSSNLVHYFKFNGPVQLCVDGQQLAGHGPLYHAHGFSSPLGRIQGHDQLLSQWSDSDLLSRGVVPERVVTLNFQSGIQVKGRLKNLFRGLSGALQVLSFLDCKVSWGDKVLFDPSWGVFDLAVGEQVKSVFGGPADRAAYGITEDFVASRVPERKLSPEQRRVFDLYQRVRNLRTSSEDITLVTEDYFALNEGPWLIGVELLEVMVLRGRELDSPEAQKLIAYLRRLPHLSDSARECVADGIKLADVNL